MRIIVQKVSAASLVADGVPHGQMAGGLLALVGFTHSDAADREKVFAYMADKLMNLRVFEDAGGKLNLSVSDIKGSVFVVSNFTLYGDARHGRRPSFTEALAPDEARAVYADFVAYLQSHYDTPIETGVFQAHMEITATLEGPVTILLDSDKTF